MLPGLETIRVVSANDSLSKAHPLYAYLLRWPFPRTWQLHETYAWFVDSVFLLETLVFHHHFYLESILINVDYLFLFNPIIALRWVGC